MEKYTREMLDSFSIHNLRDLARDFGVQSPTSKRKEILISSILEIQSGTREQNFNVNRKGRPVKSGYSSTMVISNDFNIKDMQSEYNYNMEDNRFVGMLNATPAEYGGYKKEQTNGYLDITSSGFGILRTNKILPDIDDCYVPATLIYQYNLKQGDMLGCVTSLFRVGEPNRVVDIIEINGKSAYNFDGSVRYDNLPYNTSNTKIRTYFNSERNNKLSSIMLGSRNVVLNFEGNERDGILKLINANENVYVINFMTTPEKYINLDKVLNVPFNVNDEYAVVACDLVIDICKRKMEQNENVILVFNNLDEYLKVYNNITSGYLNNNITLKTLNKIKEILLSAKYVNDCCSLTFIGITNKENSEVNNLIKEDLKSIVNFI